MCTNETHLLSRVARGATALATDKAGGLFDMWMMLTRTLAVFVLWGVLLTVGVGAGLPPWVAELAAVCGAGLTFLARAGFTRAPEHVSTAPASKSAAQRRASV